MEPKNLLFGYIRAHSFSHMGVACDGAVKFEFRICVSSLSEGGDDEMSVQDSGKNVLRLGVCLMRFMYMKYDPWVLFSESHNS